MKALVVVGVVVAGALLMVLLVWARNTWPAFAWPSYVLQVLVVVAVGSAVWKAAHNPSGVR